MRIPKDIQALAGSFNERLAFAQKVLSDPERSRGDEGLVRALLEALASESIPHAVRTAAAYLLAKLKVRAAIPILAGLLREGFTYLGDSPGYLNFDAVNALLEFGPDALPALKEALANTDNRDSGLLLTTMLYNITRDKSQVKNILQDLRRDQDQAPDKMYQELMDELEAML